MCKQSGFTLIELSIVLVVIGLIVGGIMVGVDLINSAKVTAQIKQMTDLETQINTFRGKYGCLPGDCTNATSFFGTAAALWCQEDGTHDGYSDSAGHTICNGNGNGFINGNTGGNDGTSYNYPECLMADVDAEVTQMFLHLNLAGLGTYTTSLITNEGASPPTVGVDYPASVYSNATGLFVTCLTTLQSQFTTPSIFHNGNVIVVGAAMNTGWRINYAIGTGNVVNSSNFGIVNSSGQIPIGIPVSFAQKIDMKIDDGIPNAGRFGVISGTISCGGNNYTTYPAGNSTCVVTAGKNIGQ